MTATASTAPTKRSRPAQAINNDQPSLGLNQIVVENGHIPDRATAVAMAAAFHWVRSGPSPAHDPFRRRCNRPMARLLPSMQITALFSILGTSFGGNGAEQF